MNQAWTRLDFSDLLKFDLILKLVYLGYIYTRLIFVSGVVLISDI